MKIKMRKLSKATCGLCNPVSLADFECVCVEIVLQSGDTEWPVKFAVCTHCINTMLTATETGKTQAIDIDPEVAGLFEGLMERGMLAVPFRPSKQKDG